jgi:hypothetical protein
VEPISEIEASAEKIAGAMKRISRPPYLRFIDN